MAENDSKDPNFDAIFAEAANAGYASVEIDGKEFTIVVPGMETASGTHPFIGHEHFIRIQKSRAAYSDRTAWTMAELSALAYIRFEDGKDKKNALVKALADGQFVNPVFFNSDYGTQGFLAIRVGEFAVLAFRGTEKNKDDILADLNARFLETPDGRAHKGFAKAFEAIEDDVRKALTKLKKQCPGLPVFMTGHSLGGAIATTATQVLEEKFTIAACYTFGSPRVGTAEWSESVKSPMYRIVNGADGVPMVPLSALFRDAILWIFNIPVFYAAKPYVEKFFESGFAGFQHAGDMRFIREGDPPVLKMGSAAAFARFRHVFMGKLIGALKKLNPKSLSSTFADHSISRYAAITKAIAIDRNP